MSILSLLAKGILFSIFLSDTSRKGVTKAFSPTARNTKSSCYSAGRQTHQQPISFSLRISSTAGSKSGSCPTCAHQTQLHSSREPNPFTELEVLGMRQVVLSISSERDDETRRSYVSKWIKTTAKKQDYEDGVRLIHLWDKTVIQLGEEFQQKLRSMERKKDRPCSSANLSPKDVEKKSNDSKLILWAFVDMLVQTKTLINSLNVPKQNGSRPRLHYQRMQHKLDRDGTTRPDKEESVFQ